MIVSKKKYLEAITIISKLELEFLNQKELLKNKEDEYNNLHNENQKLHNKFQSLKSEIINFKTLSADLEKLKENLMDIEVEKEVLLSDIKTLHSKKSILEQELKELEIQILNLKSEFNSQKEQSSLIQENIKNLSNQRNILKSLVEEIEVEIKHLGESRFIKSSEHEQTLRQHLLNEIELLTKSIEDKKATVGELESETLKLDEVKDEIKVSKNKIDDLKKGIISVQEENDLQEVAFYKNIFPFTTTERFKEELLDNNQEQKFMIKSKTVVLEGTNWTVNGSVTEGRKMANLNIKAMVRAYNTECDNTISSLRYSNFETTLNRIEKSFKDVNKLNQGNDLSLSTEYHNLKIQELHLVYELKKYEKNEKEKLRILREEERERKQVEKEIKERLDELDQHEKVIKKGLNATNKEFVDSKGTNLELLNKVKELEDALNLIQKKRFEVNERHLIGKSGYVYIISNIGTLGENVFKIGMTRRLEPLDRIKELSGASVPFEYDIHAMILTDDAPKLETHLHTKFYSDRVNMINNRKEFFNVTLDKIKTEVFLMVGKDVIFEDTPHAEQYYKTIALRKKTSDDLQYAYFN
ncbi:DUF4041 domain-containing protein [Sporosarcina sp. FSL K6-5500]|uniref:DUF4041 domain-containing protein n=1 Tax=Sporosarcina sp. FSL K6-5500 TaxID=2921558 RepID=UPI0030F9AE2F